MQLNMEFPEDLKKELASTIREVYAETMEQSRRDFGITKQFLTIPEAMKLFSISRNTLTNWIENDLPVYQIEGKRFIRREEAENYISNHRIN